MSVINNYFVDGKLVKQVIVTTGNDNGGSNSTSTSGPYEVFYRGGRLKEGDGFYKSYSSREEAHRAANRICGSFSEAVVEYKGRVIYSTKNN
jgi:hypothetical protein